MATDVISLTKAFDNIHSNPNYNRQRTAQVPSGWIPAVVAVAYCFANFGSGTATVALMGTVRTDFFPPLAVVVCFC